MTMINTVVKKNITATFTITAVFLLFFLNGCAPLTSRPLRICPGKNNAVEAITAVQGRMGGITAIKAYGICNLKFHDDAGKKMKESFPVRFWAEPPRQIYLQADLLFMPGAIIAGANEKEFWLCSAFLKSYAWGLFNNDGSVTLAEKVPPVLSAFSPQFLFEAMGLTKIDESSSWSLQNAGAFDILEKHNTDGRITKRIHINCCDYTVRSVEYLSREGKVTTLLELDDYKTIAAGLDVPHKIAVIRTNDDGTFTSATMKLDKVELTELSEQQKQAFFSRPKPDGFENVLKITQ